jgi:hypothetical protein
MNICGSWLKRQISPNLHVLLRLKKNRHGRVRIHNLGSTGNNGKLGNGGKRGGTKHEECVSIVNRLSGGSTVMYVPTAAPTI